MKSLRTVFAGFLLLLSIQVFSQQTQTPYLSAAPPFPYQGANPQADTPAPSSVPLSNNHYYRNSSGQTIRGPAKAPSVPQGATAVCVDTMRYVDERFGNAPPVPYGSSHA